MTHRCPSRIHQQGGCHAAPVQSKRLSRLSFAGPVSDAARTALNGAWAGSCRVVVDRARLLRAKLRACADGNGTSFVPGAVWGRIEREAERRQSEIALPR